MNLLFAENSIVFDKLKAFEYLGFKCIDKKLDRVIYIKSNKRVFIVFKLIYLQNGSYNVKIFVDETDHSPKKDLTVNNFLVILDALYQRCLKSTIFDLFNDKTNSLFDKIGMRFLNIEEDTVILINNRTKGNNYMITIRPLKINLFIFNYGNINNDSPELVALFSTAREFKRVLHSATKIIKQHELN